MNLLLAFLVQEQQNNIKGNKETHTREAEKKSTQQHDVNKRFLPSTNSDSFTCTATTKNREKKNRRTFSSLFNFNAKTFFFTSSWSWTHLPFLVWMFLLFEGWFLGFSYSFTCGNGKRGREIIANRASLDPRLVSFYFTVSRTTQRLFAKYPRESF